jgi:hypothetical protein
VNATARPRSRRCHLSSMLHPLCLRLGANLNPNPNLEGIPLSEQIPDLDTIRTRLAGQFLAHCQAVLLQLEQLPGPLPARWHLLQLSCKTFVRDLEAAVNPQEIHAPENLEGLQSYVDFNRKLRGQG